MKRGVSFIVTVAVVVSMMVAMAVPAFAATYSDVTKGKLDSKSYEAIVYVEKYKGWKGLSKNGKLYPEASMNRHEFYIVLKNLYGSKVPSGVVSTCKNSKTGMSSQFVCDQLVKLGKNLGYDIKWTGDKKKTTMKRKDVARYIKIFATFNKRFVPQPSSTTTTTTTTKTEKEALLELLKKLLGL